MTRFIHVALLAGLASASLAASSGIAADALREVEGNAVAATFGSSGRLWRVVPHRASLEVAYSDDYGNSFSKPAAIDASRQRLRVDFEGRPQIVAKGRDVYVAWTADARKPAQVFMSLSHDGGQSFSRPIAVTGAADGPKLRVLLVLDQQQAPRLYYLDPGDPRHYADRGGRLMAAGLAGGEPPLLSASPLVTGTCECCRMAAARDPDGSLAILSRMVYPGGVRDFGVIRESPRGPPQATRVTDDDWQIDACPEHGGALSIGSDGRYHMVWFTQGKRRQGLFYGYSDDRGLTRGKTLALGNRDELAGHGDVLARGDQVYLAWQEFDGRRTAVMTMQSHDRGQTWSTPTQLATAVGPADYPFLLADDRGVFVSWYAAAMGYRLLAVSAPGAMPAAVAAPAEALPRVLEKGAFQPLVAAHSGKSFGLVMWSVDCAPCLREFQLFQELLGQGKLLPLVLVATDGAERSAEVAGVLERFGLKGLESWNFGKTDPQQLRFEIDPRWYGEMPRTYFYAADGSRTAHSGGLTRAELTAWLSQVPR